MEFEWDEQKAKSNWEKHGIRFSIVTKLFLLPNRTVPSLHKDESRFVLTGVLNGTYITVVYTQRGQKTRIISARHASDEEEDAYDTHVSE